MRSLARLTTAAVVLSLSAPPAAEGQDCLNGREQPECGSVAVLEFTGAARLNEKTGPTDRSAAFLYWTGGYLKTIGGRAAVGAALKLAVDGDGHRYGPVARYRRWLTPSWSLDVTPGFYLAGKDNFTALRFPSVTADIAFNYRDRLGIAIGGDALSHRDGGTQWQTYAGVRFGTWLAPLATLGLGLLIGATW